MNWIKQMGSKYPEITVPPQDAFGFVYKIHFPDDDKCYIGRKNFWSTRKRNFGKKEAALVTDKRKKKYEMVTKESDWMTYYSSNKDVRARIENGEDYVKYILDFAYSKKHLSYLEEKNLYKHNVLENTIYYNDNIAGKYFKSDNLWELTKS